MVPLTKYMHFDNSVYQISLDSRIGVYWATVAWTFHLFKLVNPYALQWAERYSLFWTTPEYDMIRQRSLTWTWKPSIQLYLAHVARKETKTNNASAPLIQYRLMDPWRQSGSNKSDYGGKDLWKRWVLSLEWKVRTKVMTVMRWNAQDEVNHRTTVIDWHNQPTTTMSTAVEKIKRLVFSKKWMKIQTV